MLTEGREQRANSLTHLPVDQVLVESVPFANALRMYEDLLNEVGRADPRDRDRIRLAPQTIDRPSRDESSRSSSTDRARRGVRETIARALRLSNAAFAGCPWT